MERPKLMSALNMKRYGLPKNNFVFLHLKKKNGRVYYGVNERGREIDFILELEGGRYDKYQVCANLEKDNLIRELGVFHLSDKYLKKGNNLILVSKADIVPALLKKYDASQYDIIKWLLDI